MSEHIKEHGDDSVVLYSFKPPLHPQKHTRYFLKNEINKFIQALKELEEEDCFYEGSILVDIIVGGEQLTISDVNPEDFILKQNPIKSFLKPSCKFNNNSKVRLIGPPNGIEETRGKVGNIGIINHVSNYLHKTAGTPEGYSYVVKSPSFVNAICNELWVHESNLELVDDL